MYYFIVIDISIFSTELMKITQKNSLYVET